MLRTLLAVLAIGGAMPPVSSNAAVPASATELPLDRLFASPALAGPQPRVLKLSPDGKLATLLKARADDRERFDLWAIDTTSGVAKMLVDSSKFASGVALSETERMNRERQRLGSLRGVLDYDWAPDSQHLLVPIDGDLWLADTAGNVRRLTQTAATETDAQLSPQGRFVSFVRDRNLVLIDLTTGKEQPLTRDGSETLGWGAAEFIAQEELKRFTGLWWAPHDERLAVARVDESRVKVVQRAAIGADGTKVYSQRYPAAGTPNAAVELWLMNPDGAARVKVDLGRNPDYYLARVDWAPDGKALYVQRLSRDQQQLDLLRVDPATGAATVLLSETSKTWLNLHDNFRALDDGSLLWSSERSGFMHLYRWQAGVLTPLTHGDWAVEQVAGVDQAAHKLFFTGYADTPIEQHLYSVDYLKPAAPQRLTALGGWHSVVMDKTATRALITAETPTQPSQTWLADANGKRLAWIEENRVDAAHPYAPYVAGHVVPEYGVLKAADGSDLHYKLFRPAGKGPHPVMMNVYGGPGVQSVRRTWPRATEEYLVRHGWVVVQLDNRGAIGRGTAFEAGIFRHMGSVEVADQLALLTWLKTQPFVDPGKIVANGWSYGGYMVLKLLEASPTGFVAGIAGAPVTRWELYDTAYTERYLGNPALDPKPYALSNALAPAVNIARPLLLLHGMADDNVVFENSTALIAELQKARKPFDLMVYPGQTHGIAGADLNTHVWMTMLRFLGRTVAPTGY